MGDGKVVLQGIGVMLLEWVRGGRASLQHVAIQMHLHIPMVQANTSKGVVTYCLLHELLTYVIPHEVRSLKLHQGTCLMTHKAIYGKI